jgi:glyoxylase-like metal-dependent hydrolase (beta-lactamase superfamily II)
MFISTSGGLTDLPHVTVLMTREEVLFANDPGAQAKGYVVAAYSKVLPKPSAPTLQFDAKPYEVFDESADLYCDGSVVVVPLHGHTPGSVGIFCEPLTHAAFRLCCGDSGDDERGFENRVGKPLPIRF